MSLIVEVLTQLFHWQTLLVCFAGTAVGTVLGAIPGMNGGIGIAIMLPFTYSMEPARGLLFLGGMYLGSSYGGSISGILINCPGTAESACTTIEGYPMTRRGEGKRALYYSVTASAVGSVIGLLVLLLFTPVLSNISVRFGPPEMMLLAICGLTIVGSLTGKHVAKGLLAGLIGLFMAMIGIDDATGAVRFTFGYKGLRGGVELIPAVIGLFAIAEMVKQGMGIGQEENGEILTLKDCRCVDVLKETLIRYRKVVMKSSLIGTFIGILPGTGGAIASFLAYGEAKGKDEEGTFGKGNPAGIIASEAANNAAVGGSLVPMLSLGIPGSATSAIMFGALTIHGLVPGQRLFVDHADIAYTFMLGMFVTAIFMLLIGIAGIPVFATVLKLNVSQIMPIVILCSLVGAYSVNNSMNDVVAAVGCGVLGVALAKLEMPSTPVVLGLILGGLIESNFIRTWTIVSSRGENLLWYMVKRPLCIGIFLLTVYLIYANIRAMKRGREIQNSTNIRVEEQEG